MQSLENALRYPICGPWLERTLAGSLLVVGSVLVLPALVLAGYYVRVLESSLRGDDEPPALELHTMYKGREWRALVGTGIGAVAITLGYLLGPLVFGSIVALGLGAVGYSGLTALAPLVGGREELVWGLSLLAALLAALVALALVGATLAIYYVLPAALASYAHVGTIRAAFDRETLWPIISSLEYAVAIGVVQFVPLVVPVVAAAAVVSVVGIVTLPAVPFVAALLCCHVIGAAVGETAPPTGEQPSSPNRTAAPDLQSRAAE